MEPYRASMPTRPPLMRSTDASRCESTSPSWHRSAASLSRLNIVPHPPHIHPLSASVDYEDEHPHGPPTPALSSGSGRTVSSGGSLLSCASVPLSAPGSFHAAWPMSFSAGAQSMGLGVSGVRSSPALHSLRPGGGAVYDSPLSLPHHLREIVDKVHHGALGHGAGSTPGSSRSMDGVPAPLPTPSTSAPPPAAPGPLPSLTLHLDDTQRTREQIFVDSLIGASVMALTSIWGPSPDQQPTPPPSPPGHHSPSRTPAVLPLRPFVRETLRRSRTSCSTLQLALYYLHRLRTPIRDRVRRAREGLGVAGDPLNCGRRMFLASLMLASKFLQDRNYSARAWSKISGLPVGEINANEVALLALLDYNLFVRSELFDNWVLRLRKLAEDSLPSPPLSPGSSGRSSSPPSSLPSSVYSSGLLSPALHPRAPKRSQSEYLPAPSMLNDECRPSTPYGPVTSAHQSPHTPLGLPSPAASRRHSLVSEHLPRPSLESIAGRTRSASRSRVGELLGQSRQHGPSSSLHRLSEEPWLRSGDGLAVR